MEFDTTGPVAFEKMLATVMLGVIGQRSNNGLHLFYSQISCTH